MKQFVKIGSLKTFNFLVKIDFEPFNQLRQSRLKLKRSFKFFLTTNKTNRKLTQD